jgi:DNA primase
MNHDLKDRVLEAVDIVDVIGRRVALARKGKDYYGLCPFHADKNPSMAVSPTKQIFKCWSCGVGGDAIAFIQRLDRVEFREALATLARDVGIEVTSTKEDSRSRAQRDRLLAAVAWARNHFRRNLEGAAGAAAREYAERRGITPETIERFQLGLARDAWDDLLAASRQAGVDRTTLQTAGLIATNDRGKTYDRFRNRLIFPINDPAGRPVAFGGRTLGDDPAKYLNSPETPLFSKSRILYGLDRARDAIRTSDTIVVVEGYTDAVLLAQFGIENVVATLGTALTDAHMKALRPLTTNIYFCFDSDTAGVNAADRAVAVALRTQARVRVVLLPAGEDPADCVLAGGAERFQRYLNSARDALEFKWSQALSAFDAGDQRGRRAAIEQFVQFIAAASLNRGIDPLEQGLIVGQVSDVLGIPNAEVYDLLAAARRTQRRAINADRQPDAASAYDDSVSGLPRGLVIAIESVFGLLISDPGAWRWVSDAVHDAARLSQTWDTLYRLLLDVQEEVGEYCKGDVIERCEDSALCELVSRALAQAEDLDRTEEVFSITLRRLATELSLWQAAELRQPARSAPEGEHDAFRTLRQLVRGHDAALPPESRWRAASPP